MIQIIKKQGLKVALPLLLLTTACGEDTTSASQFDPLTPSADQGTEEVIKADTQLFEGSTALAPAPLTAAQAIEPANSTFENGIDLASIIPVTESAAKVPEPTALAGLAIAALGLGAIKRKQSA